MIVEELRTEIMKSQSQVKTFLHVSVSALDAILWKKLDDRNDCFCSLLLSLLLSMLSLKSNCN